MNMMGVNILKLIEGSALVFYWPNREEIDYEEISK
jgi:hypothetical protein